MKIDKRWLTQELTEDELSMFFAVASLSSTYSFDLDTIQAVRPQIMGRNMRDIVPLLNEEGQQVLENLKTKILDFESLGLQ